MMGSCADVTLKLLSVFMVVSDEETTVSVAEYEISDAESSSSLARGLDGCGEPNILGGVMPAGGESTPPNAGPPAARFSGLTELIPLILLR